MTIGVMGALPQEVESLLSLAQDVAEVRRAGRVFSRARIAGRDAVVVSSGIGKVAAAMTATELISRFEIDGLVFTGVAGALDPGLSIGDIVVAESLCQHDLDASPLFPPMEIPLVGISHVRTDARLRAALQDAAFAEISPRGGAVRVGVVASGDRFVSSSRDRDIVRSRAPGALCVEMEGAAVAQVCHAYGTPFGVVRLISDAADDHAANDFTLSLGEFAGRCAVGVVGRALASL